MLRAALAEATDTENFDYQRGRQPSKRHADFVMRLKAGIEELEKELKGSKRNPRYLVSRDGNEVGIFPGFNALMAINAARKIYGPGKYSSVKTGEAMFLGRGALQAEERLREETAARAAQKAAAKRDKIKAPGKRMKRNPTDRPALDNQLVVIGRKAYQGVRVFDIYKQPEGLFEHGLARIGNEIRWLERKNKNTWVGRPGPAGVRNVPWINQQLLIEEGHGDLIQRNPLEKSAEHPIEVTRHYRSGGPNYLSPWQRAMAIGQEELFDTGIQMLPRVAERRAALFAARNPGATKRAYESGLKEATAAQLARLVRVGLRVGLTMAEIKKDVDATGRFTAAQIDRAMDQARSAEERLAKKQNPTPDQLLQSGVNIQIFATRNERARAFAESLPNGALKKALLTGLSKTMDALMADVTIFDMPDYMGTIRHILARQIPNKPKWSAARAQLLGFFDDRESNPRRGRLRFQKPDIVFDYTKHPDIVIIRGVSLSAKTRINGMVRAGEANLHSTQPFNKGMAYVLKQYGSGRTDKKLFEKEGYIVREILPAAYVHGLKKKRSDVDGVKIARLGLQAGLAVRDVEEDLRNTGEYKPIEIDAIMAEALMVQNPSVKTIYEKFNGRPSRRSRNVAAPAGTPRDLAQLGRLRTIKTVDGRTWRFPGDRAPFLAADSRRKLHIVGGQYRANPAGEDCGEIDLIEYQTRKPHLGHDRETIYYHKLGEDTGERPTLEITPAGELLIHGGAYRIESDGIHN